MPTISFTAHRPDKIGGYQEHHPKVIQIKQDLQKIIRHSWELDYQKYIVGMALGGDTYALQALLMLKYHHPTLHITAAIPWPGQPLAWNEAAQACWKNLLQQVDAIYLVSTAQYLSLDELLALTYAAEKSPLSFGEVVYWLDQRNHWMVDESDCVVGLWNGSTGGTYNCLKYAKKKHKKIVHYHPDTRKILVIPPGGELHPWEQEE